MANLLMARDERKPSRNDLQQMGERRRVVLALTRTAEQVLQDLSADHIRELRQSAPVIAGLSDVLTPPRAGRSGRKKSQAPRKIASKKK
jgi:hypothetical protein